MKNKGIVIMLIIFVLLLDGCASENNIQTGSENLTDSIIYARNSDGISEIYQIQADGSNDKKVNGIPEKAYGPVLSPDGKRIAFYCHESDSQWSLYVLNFENSEVKKLTDEANCYDWAISWTRDSQNLYFTRSQMNAVWESEIWKINVEDASLSRVLEKQAQGGALSPDGQSILYFDYTEGGGDIWQYDINTKTSVQLTTNAGEEWWPSWSPDGKSIVYQGKHEGNFDLFSMELESRQIIQLTTSEGDEEEPQFSPDGKFIVYSYLSQGEYALYKLNLVEMDVVKLTKSGVQSINPKWCN